MLVKNLFKFKKLMKFSPMMKSVNNTINLDMDLRLEGQRAVVDFTEVASLVDLIPMISLVNSLVEGLVEVLAEALVEALVEEVLLRVIHSLNPQQEIQFRCH